MKPIEKLGWKQIEDNVWQHQHEDLDVLIRKNDDGTFDAADEYVLGMPKLYNFDSFEELYDWVKDDWNCKWKYSVNGFVEEEPQSYIYFDGIGQEDINSLYHAETMIESRTSIFFKGKEYKVKLIPKEEKEFTWQGEGHCEHCNVECDEQEDPFDSEVHGEQNLRWLCDDCADSIAQDI